MLQIKSFFPWVIGIVLGLGVAVWLPLATVSLAQESPSLDTPSSESPTANASAPTSSSPFPVLSFIELFQPSPQISTEWIRVRGTRVFRIAGYPPAIQERQRSIQANLGRITSTYLADPNAELTVAVRQSNGQPVLYINEQYVLTATSLDAQVQGMDAQLWAESIKLQLTQALRTTRRQYQRSYLIQQAQWLSGKWLGIVILLWGLSWWETQVRKRPIELLDRSALLHLKRRSRLSQTRIREVQRLILRISQFAIGIGGLLFSLSRFPHTRILAVNLVSLARVPLVLSLAVLVGYIVIRLNAIVIDRVSLAVSTNPLLSDPLFSGASGDTPKVQTSQRLQQRISTLTQVIKGVSILAIALIISIMALLTLGVDIGPLLAGAGILGVGISLASQGIIKDAINGLLIVVEDQYGVGDIVQIGEWIGLVESLNLRRTQLRNAEGKLITIPNSEIKIVANLSNYWSRVDLNIPVPYDADLTEVMTLVEDTALTMQQESPWDELIVEPPQLMGLEDFGDRGPIIKLWIKTQPLKQMDVARDYRRRLKLAFDAAGINFPVPQRSVQIVNSSSFQDATAQPSVDRSL